MKKIYKYSLGKPFHGCSEVFSMPRGAKLLDAQMQRGELCLWAEVDLLKPDEKRTFAVAGTGLTLPVGSTTYVATTQDGDYVWHLYEVTK
jgi:hypothetical protein